jgi:predicted ATP-dependent serine protease
MKQFNFRKTTKRNIFTVIFGGFGKRRKVFIPKRVNLHSLVKRNKMQMHRRAAQGWRNKRIALITTIRVRSHYGVRPPTRRFIK